MFVSKNSSALFRALSSKTETSEKRISELPKTDATIVEAKRRYLWCQRWTEALACLRRDFDGDLDQYLLFLVFEQSEMARSLSALEGSVRKDPARRAESRGMNAMSIAEICGIPRETARRKLKRLIEQRVIKMGPDGLYYLIVAKDSAIAMQADAPSHGAEASSGLIG